MRKIQKKIGYLPQEIDLYPKSYGERMSCIYGDYQEYPEMTSNKELPIIWKRLLLQSIRIKNAAIIWWYEETCRTHTGTS